MCDSRSLRSAFIQANVLFAFTLVAISLIPQEARAVLPLPGDTNADGILNGDDISGFVAAAVGGSGDPCLVQAADVDFNGTLDTADVDLFVQFLLGNADPTIYLVQPRPFLIGPIAGLTTAWHPAPSSTQMPLGTTVQLELSDLAPGDSVTWIGATEIASDPTYSRAECVLTLTGIHLVEVVLIDALGCDSRASLECIVVDITAADITCSVEVSVPPLLVDENSSNEETMSYFFPISKSIAQLTQVGPSQYRTSVARELTFTAQTQPAGFEPLMEWRRDGQVLGLGRTLADHIIDSPGTYEFTAGPTAQPEAIQIDTYSVTITSHTSFLDTIPAGEPVTFTAVTDPPGHEADITWLSSTLYGTGSPVLGSGPSFTAQFDDTWGPQGFQWLGVKADNSTFGQDLTNTKRCIYQIKCILVDCSEGFGVCPGGVGGEVFWPEFACDVDQGVSDCPFKDVQSECIFATLRCVDEQGDPLPPDPFSTCLVRLRFERCEDPGDRPPILFLAQGGSTCPPDSDPCPL